MPNHNRYFLTAILAALFAFTACDSGSEDLDNALAQRFIGSSPISISGPDAGNPDAEDEAADMVTGRRFDFTPTGFTIASGEVNSVGAAGSDYGISGGELEVDGDIATVDLDMFTADPNVENPHMRGTFSIAAATAAIADPGRSFLVDWDIEFIYSGFPINLSLQQELTGTDFVEQQ